MHKKYLVVAAIFGGLAVALGAFGAHSLERITNDEKILHSYQTAVQYQMYHSFALFLTAILLDRYFNRWLKWAANMFIAGVILFSGSLYALTFLMIQGSSLVKIAGPLTPLGGVLLIGGWLFLLLGLLQLNRQERKH
jgi:uncharacterized membrane protein YgdD (TMEM256/DUF423 family)